MAADEQVLHRAIATISQSDPLVKLLQQVRGGRMQAADAGLRAVTEAWLSTYGKTVSLPGLSRSALKRLDPMPRVFELIHAGILSAEHPGVLALKSDYERACGAASS